MSKPVQAIPASTVKELIDLAFQGAEAVEANPLVKGITTLAQSAFDNNWPAIAAFLESKGWLIP